MKALSRFLATVAAAAMLVVFTGCNKDTKAPAPAGDMENTTTDGTTETPAGEMTDTPAEGGEMKEGGEAETTEGGDAAE